MRSPTACRSLRHPTVESCSEGRRLIATADTHRYSFFQAPIFNFPQETGPGIGNSVFSRCKFFDRISLRPLVKIHPIPQPNRLRRNILQTNQVSVTGLKWLEPVPSTCCVLIGTDIALNPFSQALVRSSQQFRHWTSDFTHQTSLF